MCKASAELAERSTYVTSSAFRYQPIADTYPRSIFRIYEISISQNDFQNALHSVHEGCFASGNRIALCSRRMTFLPGLFQSCLRSCVVTHAYGIALHIGSSAGCSVRFFANAASLEKWNQRKNLEHGGHRSRKAFFGPPNVQGAIPGPSRPGKPKQRGSKWEASGPGIAAIRK